MSSSLLGKQKHRNHKNNGQKNPTHNGNKTNDLLPITFSVGKQISLVIIIDRLFSNKVLFYSLGRCNKVLDFK